MDEEASSEQDTSVEDLGADLRRLRFKAGNPTLVELQRRSGVSKSVLADALMGKQLPSERAFESLVRALGAEPTEWLARRARAAEGPLRRYARRMASPEKVFVVHGRNTDARDAMFTFLRSLGLKPIEWDQAVTLTKKGSPYIGDVLDAAFEEGQAVVVLLTPDDVTYLRAEYASGDSDPDSEPRGQARPNVLFEAGMAMGRDPDRTILVELGELRPFSDVGGRHVVHLFDSPAARKSLASRLQAAGCAVDLSGSDWLSAGDFIPPPPLGGGLPVGRRFPSSARRGANVDGRWISGGGSRLDEIKLTNNGAVPIRDLQLTVPEELTEHVRLHQDQPIAKLPVGKTATLRGWTTNSTLQGGAPDQFELRAVGRLEDGTKFEQDIFFDAG